MSDDENQLIAQRRAKLTQLRTEHGVAFPNQLQRSHLAADLHAQADGQDNDTLTQNPIRVSVAGRMMAKRIMGKASFAQLHDVSGEIQLFIQRERLGESAYQQFKTFDLGDIVSASGALFFTKTGELSIRVDTLQLLTKSLRPLPEKYHGISDTELRYRQRYVDLIMSAQTRRRFRLRSNIIHYIREFMEGRDFLEVETPMMHPIPGGAAARPFVTHHNALDMDLYLRIAPELYLKRLVVGGFERVYEINRNFRNEGLSTRHNPEFTMLEFYQAYAVYTDLMDLTEELLCGMLDELLGETQLNYQGERLDFSRPFARLTMREAIFAFNPDLEPDTFDSIESARAAAQRVGAEIKPSDGLGQLQTAIFDHTVEAQLRNPTFITGYPIEVSPLSRRNDTDPSIADRFEFFIAGREIANGFSELNDPEDQAERFRAQVAQLEAGDNEAMHFDTDYIRALEIGLPPTAGEGIGIDRLVMLLSDAASIRDVILFPHLRPERDSNADTPSEP